ncbi:MAG: sigma-70 family RNA polymerase sigma factor [Verrucomicrobiae bacterium]|nr:sigma-70 family RNA polymerase sigma factor [Verrucomicrobiae bacterium]
MKNHSRSFPEAKAAFQQSASESELVRRAKAGDMEAFEALVSQFERRVYTLALRITSNEHDAQDVTQETFLSALENLNKFREEASFTTWLSRIATHAALKIIRKRKGLPSVSLDAERGEGSDDPPLPLPDFIADWNQSPLELAQRHETRSVLDAALASLDEKHRAVFVLRDIEGLSVKETAETLGLSEANVKVRLLRARLQLRERLTRVFGDPTRRVLRQAHHHS